MSISASIDLKLISKSNSNFSSKQVINEMVAKGWKIEKNNKIFYLPLGDDNLYDWQEKNSKDIDIWRIISQKETLQEVIGINLYWRDTDIGLSTLIFNNTEISFSISINRVKINLAEFDITDINWYLERILPCFTNGISIQKITFNQD
jgi:hypothetical protein